MNSEHAPIVQLAYDLALALQRLVVHFPRSSHGICGGRIAGTSQDILELLARANCITKMAHRLDLLDDVNGRLFSLQISVRLAHDLQYLSHGAYAQQSAQIENLRKQLSGWLRWTKEQSEMSPRPEKDHCHNLPAN